MVFAVERKDEVAVVTINRPPVNAVNPEFIFELQDLAVRLGHDQSYRAVLFRSAIPGRFIAGADLTGVLQGGSPEESVPDRLRRLNREWRRTFYLLERMQQITVAAIGGHCLGGGLEFALCCDYRLMVDDGQALIGQTEVGVGLFPGAGGTSRLPHIVGLPAAKDMIYRGLRLKAPEAKAIGLVHEAYLPHGFDEKAFAFARQLAQGPTQALRAAKSAMMASLTDVALADRLEEDGFVRIAGTEDAAEGLTAFWEKRAPQFKGR